MLRSLWFRLAGTMFFVVVISMLVVFVAFFVIMRREFVDFVNSSVESLQWIPVEITEGPPVRDLQLPDIRTETRRMPLADYLNERLPGVIINETMPSINVQVPQAVQNEASQFLVTTRNAVLVAVGVSAGLAIIASTWLFWQITRPLSKLRTAAEGIAAGDLDVRVPVKSRDEVGRVAQAFNYMAGELDRQEGLRKQMVADVAHELRTPLSVMRGNLEAMIDELLPPSEDELEALNQEVLRLSRLVEDLRLLSLADSGELQLVMEPVDTAELVETAVRRLTPMAQSKEVTLLGDIGSEPCIVLGDEGKLQQVLANLIENAIRHTPTQGRVTVQLRPSATATGGDVQLVISDQGPGVDPADLPNIFERFWKGDRSRSRDSAGSGLGLAIVRKLVELHGGRISASLPEGGGLQVTITLPRIAETT